MHFLPSCLSGNVHWVGARLLARRILQLFCMRSIPKHFIWRRGTILRLWRDRNPFSELSTRNQELGYCIHSCMGKCVVCKLWIDRNVLFVHAWTSYNVVMGWDSRYLNLSVHWYTHMSMLRRRIADAYRDNHDNQTATHKYKFIEILMTISCKS